MCDGKDLHLNVVLAGVSNVGKSVIFNHFTGLHQHIGNWPGKTITKAEGTLHYKGWTIDVLDLPGSYSLATYSLEELITREYIVTAEPDFIANVVDATKLELNLLFTLQLLELHKPLILVLNMVDLLKAHGITLDVEKLAAILGVVVVPVVATQGKGLTEVLDQGLALKNTLHLLPTLYYGKEVEECIAQLCHDLCGVELNYPPRFIALKLLEKDQTIEQLCFDVCPMVVEQARKLCTKLEQIHGHDASIVIADERCLLAARIVRQVMSVNKPQHISFGETLDYVTGHRIFGYPIMILVLGIMFWTVFCGGGYVAGWLEYYFAIIQRWIEHFVGNTFYASLASSAAASFFALLALALPYIFPFYFWLFILEDLGYLARVAYLADNMLHKFGVHGKACIPLVLGFGCNVPACLACRIMETQRERLLTGLLSIFVPCSAVTVVIAGLVGKYLGLTFALCIYLLLLLLLVIVGKIAARLVPGEATGLIMEMPEYRMPNLRGIGLRIWFALREFIYVSGPIVIIAGMVIDLAYKTHVMEAVNDFFAPLTTRWLGLPAVTGVLLLFGILRKELILVMLAAVLGTTNFLTVLTPAQIMTLAVISALYIPCAATIAAFYKEFGLSKTLLVTFGKIALAIICGGIVYRLF